MQRQDFWARFHRRFHFSLTQWGVCFDYKGDEVEWVYPWKRENDMRKYFSISFGCNFESLAEIDKMWSDYEEACRKGA